MLNYESFCNTLLVSVQLIVSEVDCLNSERKKKKKKPLFINFRKENRLKFIHYLITIDISVTLCKLEVVKR